MCSGGSTALADGSLPADELKARLGAEKARKTKLTADLEDLEKLAGLPRSTSSSSSPGFRRASTTSRRSSGGRRSRRGRC